MSKDTGLWREGMRTCEICGGNVGIYGEDHTECSKAKKELYSSPIKARNKPKKTLSKSAIDFMCKL